MEKPIDNTLLKASNLTQLLVLISLIASLVSIYLSAGLTECNAELLNTISLNAIKGIVSASALIVSFFLRMHDKHLAIVAVNSLALVFLWLVAEMLL